MDSCADPASVRYEAEHTETRQRAAVKLMHKPPLSPSRAIPQAIPMSERKIYEHIRGTPGVPEIIWTGMYALTFSFLSCSHLARPSSRLLVLLPVNSEAIARLGLRREGFALPIPVEQWAVAFLSPYHAAGAASTP